MKSGVRNYVVVFADVAGSTRLYEQAGDEAAKALIVDLQSEIAGTVARTGGFIQEIVGDEVLSLFEDVNTAVSCTFAVQEATDLFSLQRGTSLSVRIGLHYGATIVEQGDRLREAARRFDRVKVKGKQEPIVVHDLLWQPASVTEIRTTALPADAPLSGLTLRYEDQCRRLEPGLGELSVGRAPDNDLVVMSGSVSRKHATVDFGRDRFILLDRSTNGTYVETQDGEIVFLRREAFPLWGRGRIALGAPVAEGIAHLLEFECQ
jgi:hypothetical protein